jgi:hypothetical protein
VRLPFRRANHHPTRMGGFRRGLTISPFQIPIMIYLFVQGVMTSFAVPQLAEELDSPVWAVWNFTISLALGALLATVARVRENERMEMFGLLLTMVAIITALGIEAMAKDYLGLLDDVMIGWACYLRAKVLWKSRKAEKVAIELSGQMNNNLGET